MEESPGRFWVATWQRVVSWKRMGWAGCWGQLEGRRHLTAGLSLRNGARMVGGARRLLQMKPGASTIQVLAFPETVTALCERRGRLFCWERGKERSIAWSGVLQRSPSAHFGLDYRSAAWIEVGRVGGDAGSGSLPSLGCRNGLLYRGRLWKDSPWPSVRRAPADAGHAVDRHCWRSGVDAGRPAAFSEHPAWKLVEWLSSPNPRGMTTTFGSGVTADIPVVASVNFRTSPAGRANMVHPLALDELDGMVWRNAQAATRRPG